jgi:hypothetical protein
VAVMMVAMMMVGCRVGGRYGSGEHQEHDGGKENTAKFHTGPPFGSVKTF